MIRNLFRFFTKPVGMMSALVIMTGFTLSFYNGVMHKSPGPLTAVQAHNEPLGGYASHSEFEQECSHCHAPIHCITDNRCQSCHMEIAEQRTEATGLHGLLPGTSRCQSCHVDHKGRETIITTFAFNNVDHTQLAAFSLENHKTDYTGSDMNCTSCHQLGRFGAESLDCVTCHTQNDARFMTDHTTQYGSDCAGCHDGHDRLANFDHNQVFPLDGQHRDVACESCHIDKQFAGTPTTCAGCHEQPDVHDSSFGQECIRCHTTAGWLPAELRIHPFPLDHGAEEEQPCQTCHENRYTEYPCYTCHDAAETEVVHEEQNVTAFENCLECHPLGQVEDANDIQVKDLGTTGVVAKINR
ncbi:MAG: cytochrome c3 family protein [Anaerolineae bacterium]|nr:cytochrome c3 family protein [Anaerolineae bacterium]